MFGSARSPLRISAALFTLGIVGLNAAAAQDGGRSSSKSKPFVVAEQGSFAVGGTVVTNPGTFDPVGLEQAALS